MSSLEDFEGLSHDGYGIEINNGDHLSTPEEEFVEVGHGQEYSIRVANFNSHKCRFDLNIDGSDQGSWQIESGTEADIERPAEVAKKFTFYRVKYAPEASGIEEGKAENGLITCTFTPEINAPDIQFHVFELGRKTSGYRFQLFAKNTTMDLADCLKEIIEDHLGEDPADCQVLRWHQDGPHGREYEDRTYFKSYIDLGVDWDNCLCNDDYYEGYEYTLHIMRPLSAKIFYNDKVMTYYLPSVCEILEAIAFNWGLEKFHVLTEHGRVIACTSWKEDQDIHRRLRKEELEDAFPDGFINFKVLEGCSPTTGSFEVSVIHHDWWDSSRDREVYTIQVQPDTTVKDMRELIRDQARIPSFMLRLTSQWDSGRKPGALEHDRYAADIPAIINDRKVHLFRILQRGGGGGPVKDVSPSNAISESSGRKMLDAPDSDWRAGATTLGKKSEQKFKMAPALEVEHGHAVTLSLRLVAREDEMSEEEYEKYLNTDCTPLCPNVSQPVEA